MILMNSSLQGQMTHILGYGKNYNRGAEFAKMQILLFENVCWIGKMIENWKEQMLPFFFLSKRRWKNWEIVDLSAWHLLYMNKKILEQSIKMYICEHLDRNAIINKNQHEFFHNKLYQIKLISPFNIITS